MRTVCIFHSGLCHVQCVTLTLIYYLLPAKSFAGIWLFGLFNGCCIDLRAFKMFQREVAMCLDGWETSPHWLISRAALPCKQGVMKHCITRSSWMRCALCAFLIGPQSRPPQVLRGIWYSAYKKRKSAFNCDVWFTLIVRIQNIGPSCFFWQMLANVGLNDSSEKHSVGS